MRFSPGDPFTVNSRKYDGSVRRSWRCELVAGGDDHIDLIGTFDEAVDHPDLGRIEKDTISRERFYLNRWYNYFTFEYPAGTFRNYYINICMPPMIGEGVIDFVDLDIDVIVWPDGSLVILDMEEFAANSKAFRYPSEVRATASATLRELVARLDRSDLESVHRTLVNMGAKASL